MECQEWPMSCHNFFTMLLGFMSHGDFKKWQSGPVEFKSHEPHGGQREAGLGENEAGWDRSEVGPRSKRGWKAALTTRQADERKQGLGGVCVCEGVRGKGGGVVCWFV